MDSDANPQYHEDEFTRFFDSIKDIIAQFGEMTIGVGVVVLILGIPLIVAFIKNLSLILRFGDKTKYYLVDSLSDDPISFALIKTFDEDGKHKGTYFTLFSGVFKVNKVYELEKMKIYANGYERLVLTGAELNGETIKLETDQVNSLFGAFQMGYMFRNPINYVNIGLLIITIVNMLLTFNIASLSLFVVVGIFSIIAFVFPIHRLF